MTKLCVSSGDFPFSKVVVHSFTYTAEVAGQIGLVSGSLVEGIQAQTKVAMDNLVFALQQICWGVDDVIKVRIFLSDMQNYETVNEIYATYFTKDYPARVALAVKQLPLGALIEVECTAASNTAPRT